MISDRKIFKYPIFVIVYALAILIKETAILLIPIFILYFIIGRYILKKELYLSDLFYTCICPLIIAVAVYIIAAGTPSHVLEVIKIILTSPLTNKHAILYCAGPAFRYIVDFILLSPWVSILAIGFFFSFISAKECEDKILYFSTIFVVYFLLLNLFAKNVRYAIFLDTPLRMFSVFMLLNIEENRFKKLKHGYLITYILVIAIAVYDYLSFYKFFVIYDIYDPISIFLLRARELIPPMYLPPELLKRFHLIY
jgi:hypothetical protein